jgi:hypothetical protein
MPTEHGRTPDTPLGRERRALYFKNRRIGVPAPRATWAGRTVSKLYHKTKSVMNERGKSYLFGAGS